MPYFIIIIAIIFIILLFIEKIKLDKRKAVEKQQWDLSMYSLKNSILTERELQFYDQLKEIIPNEYFIAPKVGIKDFIEIKSGKDYMKYFGHISQKHIDFLICSKNRLQPILGIELDDQSHKQAARSERDKKVDALYSQIGLQIIHISTRAKNEEIKRTIIEILKNE